MKYVVVIMAVGALSGLVGCAALEGMERDIQMAVDQTEPVATALNAPTSGISGLAYLVLSNVVTAGLAVNRAMVAHQRKKAIEEVDVNPDTPSAVEQVASASAKKSVRQVTG